MKKLLLLPILFIGSIVCMGVDSGNIGSTSDNTFQSSIYDLITNWDSRSIDYSGPETSSTSTESTTTDCVTTSTQDNDSK